METNSILVSDVVQRADVRMIQACDGARLALKPFAQSDCYQLARGVRENLDGDGTVQASVAGLVDLAHATRTKLLANLVGTEPCADSQTHNAARIIDF